MPRSHTVLFFALAVIGCATDLLTKDWVFRRLGMPGESGRWWLWEGYVGIETALNEGALFGVGQGKVALFAVLSIVAAAGILVWLFCFRAARDRLLTVALGCVMGGILGNLYDRLGLWSTAAEPIYAVRDWILLTYGPYTWPNFNIADSLLVSGAAMLAWHAFWYSESSTAQSRTAARSTG